MQRTTLSVLLALAAMELSGCGLLGSRDRSGRPPRSGKQLKPTTVEDIEAEASQPRSGLQFAIRLNKADYRLDDPIELDLRLENVTGSPAEKGRDIPVYFEPFAKMPSGEFGEWLFKFIVRSESDDSVKYRSPEFDVKEADRDGYYHFVTLPPGSFVGRKFVFPPGRSGNWLVPGRYSVLVSYTVSDEYPLVILNRHFTTAQADQLGKLAYVRVWTGQLFSNRVEFRVLGRRRGLW